jgi:hypothetical protein
LPSVSGLVASVLKKRLANADMGERARLMDD